MVGIKYDAAIGSANAVEPIPLIRRFELRQIYLLLTRQCNLNCSHCIRSSSPFQQEMIDTQLAMHILQQLHIIRREATLMVSGGEPSLHPSFKLIVAAGLERFDRVVVNSNGLRLAPLLEACAHPAAEIQISVDGDDITHDRIRGHGTFAKTIANINQLSRCGIFVTVATTVTKSNISSLKKLDRILADAHFARWNVKRVVGAGRASDTDDISTLVWNQLVAEFRATTLNADRLRISFMFSEEGIQAASSSNGLISGDGLEIANANCGTGRSKLYVNPDGTAYPCACMEEIIVGNFSSQSALEILRLLNQLEVEPSPKAVCHRCPAWKVCRGGCPGAAKRTIVPALGDPRCPLATAGRLDAGESNEA